MYPDQPDPSTMLEERGAQDPATDLGDGDASDGRGCGSCRAQVAYGANDLARPKL
jgi:hypothetical protein